MAPRENPITWIPYGTNNDCSRGLCSTYCPQWCYIVYPAPQPPFEYPDDDSNPKFSPIVIAIIGILVTAFLLLSYYLIVSKYCGHRESTRRSENPNQNDHGLQDNHNNHESYNASATGLDESQIKSIAVYKYNKLGNSFVGITDCSVCLSEFQDGECVRILPKCNHAFHLPCIDKWLKSQSSCPLCRAWIFNFNASAHHDVPAASVIELPSIDDTSSGENIEVGGDGGNEFGVLQEVNMHYSDAVSKPALRAFSDLSNNLEGMHRIIEINDEVYESIRSMSMDHAFQSGISVADVNQEEDSHHVERFSKDAGSSKRSTGESSMSSYKRRVLHCVISPIAMKRPFPSGRFSFRKIDRGRQGIIHA